MILRSCFRHALCVMIGLLLVGWNSKEALAQTDAASSPTKPAKEINPEASDTPEVGEPMAKLTGGLLERLSDGSTGQATQFEGAGGVKIAAYLRVPAGPGPFPVVLMLHGGNGSPNGAYGLGRRIGPPTGDFVAAGWAVYSIDFRPKATIPAPGTVSEETDPMLQDAINAVAAARSYPFIDPKKLAIMGGSRGGKLMARLTTHVDGSGGILCSPAGLDLIEDAKVIARGEKINPAIKSMVKALERRDGTNIEEIAKNPEKYHYSSPIAEAAKVRFPLLLISGRNDVSSPIGPLDAYVKKLQESGKVVETYFPDNGPHGFYYGFPHEIPETKEAARHAVEFLQKCFAQSEKSVN